MKKEIIVIKKDGTREPFDGSKIVKAVGKSAARILYKLTPDEENKIVKHVEKAIEDSGQTEIPIAMMHSMVEAALVAVNQDVAKSYRDYRNYKQEFVHMMDDVYVKSQSIRYIGDKENANTDSTLVATKRSLIFNELNKSLYRKFFMNRDELQACKDGYIYVHDQSARLDTFNCFGRATKFITSEGVKSFYDFIDGDEIMVLSHKGIWRKAIVHAYGWQKVQEVTLKRGPSKPKKFIVTPNHRWLLKDGTITTELKIGDKLIQTPDITSFNWNDLTRQEKKIWCLGFGFADGGIMEDNSIPTMHIRLCGEKIKYGKRFEDVGYSVTYPKCYDGDAYVRMQDIHSKDLPFYKLNYKNIQYFMNGYLCADGCRNLNESGWSYFKKLQTTGDFNKYAYDLLNIAGYYVTSISDLTGQTTNYGVRTKETKSYQIYSNCGNQTWKVIDIQPAKLNSKAQVWCLDVEEDHSFLLEGGVPTGNCDLFDAKTVMTGGFEMGNIWYNEPKTLDTAWDILGDLILSTAAQQYGGFTVPEVDKLVAPYAEKSFKKYKEEYLNLAKDINSQDNDGTLKEKAKEYAIKKVKREMEQGYQGIEYKLNTVGSSRGDYPFVTFTFGLGTNEFEKMASKTILEVHMEGQGKKGFKRPVLFPKLVFLYDKNIHGEGKICNDVFEIGIQCSAKTMYPRQIGA